MKTLILAIRLQKTVQYMGLQTCESTNVEPVLHQQYIYCNSDVNVRTGKWNNGQKGDLD